MFTVLLFGQESPRKGPGWTTHLSWPLNSQLHLSYGSSTLGCTINAHYALCLHSGFCQGLYHLKNISAFQSLMRQSAVDTHGVPTKEGDGAKTLTCPRPKGKSGKDQSLLWAVQPTPQALCGVLFNSHNTPAT